MAKYATGGGRYLDASRGPYRCVRAGGGYHSSVGLGGTKEVMGDVGTECAKTSVGNAGVGMPRGGCPGLSRETGEFRYSGVGRKVCFGGERIP